MKIIFFFFSYCVIYTFIFLLKIKLLIWKKKLHCRESLINFIPSLSCLPKKEFSLFDFKSILEVAINGQNVKNGMRKGYSSSIG